MTKFVPQSPFAPKDLPQMPPIAGVRLGACEAGIRYSGRTDLMLALFDTGTVAGGAFTRSKTASAPVEWCRERVPSDAARALVVNAGNANAFTGMKGRRAVEVTAEAAADAVGCKFDQILIASTGIIGEALNAEKLTSKLADLADTAEPDGWENAARAIMTTDTYPKLVTRSADIGGIEVTINGVAKGAGMIAPDMATMLAFLFTDAPISGEVCQALCARTVETTLNAITVDGDTSTSDTVLLIATGAARGRGALEVADPADSRLAGFAVSLEEAMRDLAHQIVKDGEGAKKFIEIAVQGAESDRAAKRIAFAIANSPLVKTAIGGEDPNWGRIVMAVGKAGEAANRDRLVIWLGDIRVARNGEADPAYDEKAGAAYMRNREIALRVDVAVGQGSAKVWTCDLTHDYITINADYRS